MGMLSDLLRNVNVERGFSAGLAQGITSSVESRLEARAAAIKKQKEEQAKLEVQNAAILKDTVFHFSNEEYQSINENPAASLEAVAGDLRTNQSRVSKLDKPISGFRKIAGLTYDITNPTSPNLYLNLHRGVNNDKYLPGSPQHAAYTKMNAYLTGAIQEIQFKRLDKLKEGAEPGDLYQMLGLTDLPSEVQEVFRPLVANALGKSVPEAITGGQVPSDLVLSYDPNTGAYNQEVVLGAGNISQQTNDRIKAAVSRGNAYTAYSTDAKDYKFAKDPSIFADMAAQGIKKDFANIIGQGAITEKMVIDSFEGSIDLFSSGAIRGSAISNTGLAVINPDAVRKTYLPIITSDPKNGLANASLVLANAVPLDIAKSVSAEKFLERRFGGEDYGDKIQSGIRENNNMLKLVRQTKIDLQAGGRTDIVGSARLFFAGVGSAVGAIMGVDAQTQGEDASAIKSIQSRLGTLRENLNSSDEGIQREARLKLLAYEIAYAKARLAENPEGGSVRITDLDKRAAAEAVQLYNTFQSTSAAIEVMSELEQRSLIDLQIYQTYGSSKNVSQLMAMRALEIQYDVADIRRSPATQSYTVDPETGKFKKDKVITATGARIVTGASSTEQGQSSEVQQTRPGAVNPLTSR